MPGLKTFHLRDPNQIFERLTEIVAPTMAASPTVDPFLPEPEMTIESFLSLNRIGPMDWFLICTALEIEYQIVIPSDLITPEVTFAEFCSGLSTLPIIPSHNWVFDCLLMVRRVCNKANGLRVPPPPTPEKVLC